ncbi:hypothetical protein TNCV_2198861 [Trichonephila clavipes]|nr:hypothetical protein TNCV_2198861 [Trichonephila clavipes]
MQNSRKDQDSSFKSDENLLSKIQSLKYRIQQQYSQNKSQKVFTPSTPLRRCLKYTYIKDCSQAIARSTAEIITNRFNSQSNANRSLGKTRLTDFRRASLYLYPSRIIRERSTCVIGLEISVFLY